MAATAAEARFRIEYPFQPRDSRVIAVDSGADEVVCRAAGRHWSGIAHFLTFAAPVPGGGNGTGAAPPTAADATLRMCTGSTVRLSDELADADVAVMVSASGGAEAASLIGGACARRGIMTAGIALGGPGDQAGAAAAALRPHAMVLVVPADEDDVLELLTALRA